MHLLLLEPDKILADNFCRVFNLSGFNTVVLFDAQSAIEEIDNKMPDAIVLELQLAPIGGIAFLYELRSYQDLLNIPIIVYSSLPPENFELQEQQWADLGVVRYFYKSTVSISKVANYINEYLS